jgi:glycosyltransferase involved in cell wall biosynthesis
VTPRKRLVDSGRILILSYFFPPISAGPTFVIRALLGQFHPSSMTVVAGSPARYPLHIDASLSMSADVRRFDVPRWWPIEDTELRLAGRPVRVRARALGNVLVALRVALVATRELRKSQTRALLAVYPKQHFLLAACLASLVSRKPLLVYFMDVYVEGLGRGRRVARLIERLVASRASVVFAMSAPHREHLRKKLTRGGRAPTVVELPHPYAEEEGENDHRSIPEELRPAVVFTGAIYDAQAEAIRRFVMALTAPELAHVHLHLVTQTPLRDLAAHGIEQAERVHVRAATRAGARAAQRAADVLYLPIAFDAKEHVRRTASPSKMPEYLAAGVPILVHAPPDSYIARYATERGFALVVSNADAGELGAAVLRLLGDEATVKRLRARAQETLERHHAPVVADAVRRAIQTAVAAP